MTTIHRSPDEVAEYTETYRLSEAERAGVAIIDRLPDEQRAQYYAWLEAQKAGDQN